MSALIPANSPSASPSESNPPRAQSFSFKPPVAGRSSPKVVPPDTSDPSPAPAPLPPRVPCRDHPLLPARPRVSGLVTASGGGDHPKRIVSPLSAAPDSNDAVGDNAPDTDTRSESDSLVSPPSAALAPTPFSPQSSPPAARINAPAPNPKNSSASAARSSNTGASSVRM